MPVRVPWVVQLTQDAICAAVGPQRWCSGRVQARCPIVKIGVYCARAKPGDRASRKKTWLAKGGGYIRNVVTDQHVVPRAQHVVSQQQTSVLSYCAWLGHDSIKSGDHPD